MPTVNLDHMFEVSCKEQDGSIIELTRQVQVTGVDGSSIAKVPQVYTALDGVGLTYYSTTTADSNLYLIDRNVSMVDQEVAECTLTWRAQGLAIGQVGVFIPRIASTLNQRDTNFDIWGNQITASHTYPDGTTPPGVDADPERGGETFTVTATVPQLIPQTEIAYDGLLQMAAPIAWAKQYLGFSNLSWWNGGVPGTWLCSAINIEPWDAGTTPLTWRIGITFQHDLDTWDGVAIFVDDRTNEPPTNLVSGVGTVTVNVQPRAEFWDIIPG